MTKTMRLTLFSLLWADLRTTSDCIWERFSFILPITDADVATISPSGTKKPRTSRYRLYLAGEALLG